MPATDKDLEEFRAEVRAWCKANIPAGWRAAQTGVPDADYESYRHHL